MEEEEDIVKEEEVDAEAGLADSQGVVGERSDRDKRLTRFDDGHETKMFGNQNYCHTHGWYVAPTHDSGRCSYPDSCHDATATADDTKNGCELYKRLSHKA